jgi:hypothetical protein
MMFPVVRLLSAFEVLNSDVTDVFCYALGTVIRSERKMRKPNLLAYGRYRRSPKRKMAWRPRPRMPSLEL